MRKPFLTLLFAILASTTALWASDTQVDGIWYDFNEKNMTATITYRGSNYDYESYSDRYMGDITIPESVMYNSKIYSVTRIGSYAFYYCSSLASVTIPNTVTSIGSEAFNGCSGLTSPVYNEHVFAFMPTSFTGHYSIPEDIESIADYAFNGCSSLISVTIPNSVTSIGSNAFKGCSSLTSITIPNSVTSIGVAIFSGCSSLTSPVYNEHVFAFMPTSFTGHYSIPKGIESIAIYAFNGCSGLTSITIPNSVTSIGSAAFFGCSSLTSVTIPNSVTSIGSYAFDGCSSLTSVTIPNSVTSIGNSAFYRCSSLTSITIPNSVTSIGSAAFYGCSSLTSVTIGNSVTSIGERAFNGCSSLTSVTIGNSLTSIGYAIFYDCSSLTSITIPNSVTSIGDYAFDGCSSLTSVTIGNNVTSIGNDAFRGCSGLNTIVIPANVEHIGSAFMNCTNLKKIYSLSKTPPTISSYTFREISDDAEVYVSKASLNKYKNYSSSNYWKDMNLIGIDFYAIDKSVTATSVTLNATHNLWELCSIYIVSIGLTGGEMLTGNVLESNGLDPESEYKNFPVVLTSNTGETDTVNVSFTTTALKLTSQQPKVVSSTAAILLAETNMSDAEVNCGFEWRRENQPEAMASTQVYAPVANGTMAGRLKGLKDDVYYKYRAFYESSAGNKYYGDWQYIFTGDDAVEFDPIMYTYPASAVTETTATLKGYALAGSDEFTEQGFEYWVEVRIIPMNANNAPKRAYHSAVGEHKTVQASGISMKVTLTDLDEGSVYKYRTYAVVDGQKVYGEEQSFTTRGEYLYTVTFVDYDGTVLGTDKVAYGNSATAPAEPTRDGYLFDGWDADFSVVTDEMTVTAVYSVATALPDTQLPESVRPIKLIRDGQLLILRDGKTYTVQGLQIK